MRVLPPLEITSQRLTSSTAAEPGVGEVAYNIASTYALGDKVILGSPSSTVTITIASPGVISWATNGLPDGTPVVLTTTGALPTGLVAGTIYYVVNRAAGTFQLSATVDGAPIVTTGSQSGVHTATAQVHRRYESMAATNTGNPPAVDNGTKWLDVGPTNRWAMLDLLRNTGTVGSSPMVTVLTPGQRVDAIAAVGIVADSITVAVASASGSYSHTESLSTRASTGWFRYFFGKFTYRSASARFDLPPWSDAVITVTLTRATGDVTLGGLLIGQAIFLGNTQFSAVSDVLNFSKVDRDEFGNSILVRRRTAPITSQQLWCDKSNANNAIAVREALNAEVALWSGLDDPTDGYFEPLLILGYYRHFGISLDQPDVAQIVLELEEV